jgi:hypothetical protein
LLLNKVSKNVTKGYFVVTLAAWKKGQQMRTPWATVAIVCGMGLAGCDGVETPAAEAQKATPVASPPPVQVTWQPINKTAEFLSAWRQPKDPKQ